MSRNAKIALLVILALIFVAEAAVAAVVVLHRSKNHSSGLAGSNAQTKAAFEKDACAIFTLADAKKALDGNVSGGPMSDTGSSQDIQVSGCSYKPGDNTGSTIGVSKTASLIVHHPKTPQGIASNQKIFEIQQPPGNQTETGYGDKSFWDSRLGQLDILKHNNWYILTIGPATPADRSLAQTKLLADILSAKL